MKKLLSILIACLFALNIAAQVPDQTFIKGSVLIKFDSRLKSGAENITDKYTLDLNVSNSALFKGIIEHRPFIKNTISANQPAQLVYNLETSIVNPKNPAQTKNVGQIIGVVPIDENNLYNFGGGSAKINVFGVGQARGFESKFNGMAQGKPPVKSGFAALKQDALKLVNSKNAAITVTKYDKMEFQNIVLAAGPVGTYTEVVVSGVFLYDYTRSAWYFTNFTVSYTADGKRIQDSITGDIRWAKGAYEFSVKVNEPLPSESAVFSAVADEAAFFASDDETPSLTGKCVYKDSESGGKVVASNVTVDLVGNKLTKNQTMVLAKLLFLVAVVPFNAE